MESTTLKKKRLEFGLTQTQLGKRLGVSRKTILNYETGITVIPETKAQLLDLIFIDDLKITKNKKSEVILISRNVLAGILPYLTQLENSVSEMKCELEAIKIYMKTGQDL